MNSNFELAAMADGSHGPDFEHAVMVKALDFDLWPTETVETVNSNLKFIFCLQLQEAFLASSATYPFSSAIEEEPSIPVTMVY